MVIGYRRKGMVTDFGLRLIMLVVALAVAGITGCGEETPHTVPVSGKVIYNGQPLKSGLVTLIPEASGNGATGQIQPDGTFVLTSFKQGDGAAPGQYKVTIQVFEGEGGANAAPPLPGSEQDAATKPPVPLKYTNPATTPERALINDGETELVINLQD